MFVIFTGLLVDKVSVKKSKDTIYVAGLFSLTENGNETGELLLELFNNTDCLAY